MKTVKLIREKKQPSPEYQTLGTLWFEGRQLCVTLELPWKDNRQRISCIPKGKYNVRRRVTEKYGEHFHVLDVPSRSYILIHNANYYYDLLGCIGVGKEFKFINRDAHLDVTSSKATMKILRETLPEEFELIIE